MILARSREEVLAARARWVVVDELQKVPALLDEGHWLIENQRVAFALCGSSARKLNRGHANLLGGRAVRYELHGLVSAEVGRRFDLRRALNHGYLPRHYLADDARDLLRAYLDDYLKEEIAADGLSRNLPAFGQFLTAAALGDGQLVNYTTIGRDCGVSEHTVREYFAAASSPRLRSVFDGSETENGNCNITMDSLSPMVLHLKP